MWTCGRLSHMNAHTQHATIPGKGNNKRHRSEGGDRAYGMLRPGGAQEGDTPGSQPHTNLQWPNDQCPKHDTGLACWTNAGLSVLASFADPSPSCTPCVPLCTSSAPPCMLPPSCSLSVLHSLAPSPLSFSLCPSLSLLSFSPLCPSLSTLPASMPPLRPLCLTTTFLTMMLASRCP